MSQCEDRISAVEDKIAVHDHAKKDFLKIARDHKNSIQ